MYPLAVLFMALPLYYGMIYAYGHFFECRCEACERGEYWWCLEEECGG